MVIGQNGEPTKWLPMSRWFSIHSPTPAIAASRIVACLLAGKRGLQRIVERTDFGAGLLGLVKRFDEAVDDDENVFGSRQSAFRRRQKQGFGRVGERWWNYGVRHPSQFGRGGRDAVGHDGLGRDDVARRQVIGRHCLLIAPARDFSELTQRLLVGGWQTQTFVQMLEAAGECGGVGLGESDGHDRSFAQAALGPWWRGTALLSMVRASAPNEDEIRFEVVISKFPVSVGTPCSREALESSGKIVQVDGPYCKASGRAR